MRQHRSFPKNIIRHLDLNENDLPYDFLGTLYYIIYTELSERERYALFEYYTANRTYESIGKTLDVTRQRTREIIVAALRKLSCPKNKDILKIGLDKHIAKSIETYTKKQKISYEVRIDILREQVAHLQNRPVWETGDISQPLSKLSMSTRLRNVLEHIGCETISDIIKIGPAKIAQSKNIGEATFVELCDIMTNKFGQDEDLWKLTKTFKNKYPSTKKSA